MRKSRVIAFIAVRGGSKSIPLKNIKDFCGKPLVYWSLLALQNTNRVDEVIVATDADQIEKVVTDFNFDKVSIYRRSAENASDEATTESVMLEYIRSSALYENDIFMLVQATSPLTQSCHLEGGLDLYFKGSYDSILSCVRIYRFFWNEDGSSENYDYQHRPRRQEFKGELMENGAFYINTVGNILLYKNRLCKKIGIYEMPSYTSYELDEEEDWYILESLMYNKILNKQDSSKRIKLFLSDVDGVLTDGGMYYAESGDELKRFNTRDGMGFELLRKAGIKTGIITSEATKIVENRAKKLKVDYVFQGQRAKGKLQAALEICSQEHIDIAEVAYIGDDINCLELLKSVGVKACPADAVVEIKNIPGIIILDTLGGQGAVREFVSILLDKRKRYL